MPGMDGYQVMGEIYRQNPDAMIVILTGHASIKSAVTALKRGAYDYLRKPFEHEDLVKTVKNALHHKKTATSMLEKRIKDLSPLSVLKRGYSITRKLPDLRVLRDSSLTHEGDLLQVSLARGELRCRVEEVSPKKNEQGQDEDEGSP